MVPDGGDNRELDVESPEPAAEIAESPEPCEELIIRSPAEAEGEYDDDDFHGESDVDDSEGDLEEERMCSKQSRMLAETPDEEMSTDTVDPFLFAAQWQQREEIATGDATIVDTLLDMHSAASAKQIASNAEEVAFFRGQAQSLAASIMSTAVDNVENEFLQGWLSSRETVLHTGLEDTAELVCCHASGFREEFVQGQRVNICTVCGATISSSSEGLDLNVAYAATQLDVDLEEMEITRQELTTACSVDSDYYAHLLVTNVMEATWWHADAEDGSDVVFSSLDGCLPSGGCHEEVSSDRRILAGDACGLSVDPHAEHLAVPSQQIPSAQECAPEHVTDERSAKKYPTQRQETFQDEITLSPVAKYDSCSHPDGLRQRVIAGVFSSICDACGYTSFAAREGHDLQKASRQALVEATESESDHPICPRRSEAAITIQRCSRGKQARESVKIKREMHLAAVDVVGYAVRDGQTDHICTVQLASDDEEAVFSEADAAEEDATDPHLFGPKCVPMQQDLREQSFKEEHSRMDATLQEKRLEIQRLQEEERDWRHRVEKLREEETLRQSEAQYLQDEEEEEIQERWQSRLRIQKLEADAEENSFCDRSAREDTLTIEQALQLEDSLQEQRREIERLQQELEEQQAKTEEERLRRQNAERRHSLEIERVRKEEAERQHRLEEDRVRKEEAERQHRLEEERVRREEAETQHRLQVERLRREEAARHQRLEAERLRKEEAEQQLLSEAERLRREEAERQRRQLSEQAKDATKCTEADTENGGTLKEKLSKIHVDNDSALAHCLCQHVVLKLCSRSSQAVSTMVSRILCRGERNITSRQVRLTVLRSIRSAIQKLEQPRRAEHNLQSHEDVPKEKVHAHQTAPVIATTNAARVCYLRGRDAMERDYEKEVADRQKKELMEDQVTVMVQTHYDGWRTREKNAAWLAKKRPQAMNSPWAAALRESASKGTLSTCDNQSSTATLLTDSSFQTCSQISRREWESSDGLDPETLKYFVKTLPSMHEARVAAAVHANFQLKESTPAGHHKAVAPVEPAPPRTRPRRPHPGYSVAGHRGPAEARAASEVRAVSESARIENDAVDDPVDGSADAVDALPRELTGLGFLEPRPPASSRKHRSRPSHKKVLALADSQWTPQGTDGTDEARMQSQRPSLPAAWHPMRGEYSTAIARAQTASAASGPVDRDSTTHTTQQEDASPTSAKGDGSQVSGLGSGNADLRALRRQRSTRPRCVIRFPIGNEEGSSFRDDVPEIFSARDSENSVGFHATVTSFRSTMASTTAGSWPPSRSLSSRRRDYSQGWSPAWAAQNALPIRCIMGTPEPDVAAAADGEQDQAQPRQSVTLPQDNNIPCKDAGAGVADGRTPRDTSCAVHLPPVRPQGFRLTNVKAPKRSVLKSRKRAGGSCRVRSTGAHGTIVEEAAA